MPEHDGSPLLSEQATYECECCYLKRCPEKMKGVGYYCPECFALCYAEWQDCGREGAKFQTHDEYQDAVDALHKELAASDN